MSSTSTARERRTGAARLQHALNWLLARNVLIAGGALALAVVLAWTWLLKQPMSGGGMEGGGMPMSVPPPLSAAYLLPAFTMWALMMVAMMLPSAAPMILLRARIDRAPLPNSLWHTAIFALAYVAIWTLFSAVAALGQALLIEARLLSAMNLSLRHADLAAIVLLAAALYQLSWAKQACLDQCRSPILFIMRYWSPGVAGALRLGLAHGLYCLGCCWGLMLLLFVGGVMNLAWVAVLAIIVLVEKVAPYGWRAPYWIAFGLSAAALLLLLWP